jgi:hypothetical protein
MRKYLLLAVMLSACCFPAFAQSPQIRTATFLNNLNTFRDVFGDQGYPRANAEDLAADDDIYGCSSKLIGTRDSSGPFHNNFSSSLALQGFGFTIPDDATIENIAVRIRRFNNGRSPVGDLTLSLMQRYQCGFGPCTYGVFWTYRDEYPGKIYPDAETEYIFSQGGSGNNGGFNHDQEYQWTPAIVNHTFFGVRIDSYPPIGKGPAQICYDLVEVTVEFSQPATIAGRSSVATEAKPLKEPIVYPNPFTTKTNIQFTAIETGNAVMELYNISGVKLGTLFSGHVVEGQVYNIAAGDTRLPNGIYVYMIRNGKQKHIGRIIKLE